MKLVLVTFIFITGFVSVELCGRGPFRTLAFSDRRQFICVEPSGWYNSHWIVFIFKDVEADKTWYCDEMWDDEGNPHYDWDVVYPPKPASFDNKLSFSFKVKENGQIYNCFQVNRYEAWGFKDNGFSRMYDKKEDREFCCLNSKNKRNFS